MDEHKSDLRFLPFALVGIILVLGFMVFYSKIVKLTNKPVDKTTQEKITTENEFANPPVTTTENFLLNITSPQNNATVKSALVSISGKTVANADIYINEIDSKADKNGNFNVSYTLDEGENYLVIGANDEMGNYLEKELTLYYLP